MKYLVVIDAQNDFITGPLAIPGATEIADNIITYILNEDHDQVIATIDSHSDNDADTVEQSTYPEHCHKHSAGAALYGSLAIHVDTFIEKSTFMVPVANMQKWEIDDVDIDMNDEFEICGFATDICVISNALLLRSLFPCTKITVLENLCAGTTPDNHKAALEIMKANCINIKSL